MKLVDVAEAISMVVVPLRLDKALEVIFDVCRTDVKLTAEILVLLQVVTDSVQGGPVEFYIPPEECGWSFEGNFLDYPATGELGIAKSSGKVSKYLTVEERYRFKYSKQFSPC